MGNASQPRLAGNSAHGLDEWSRGAPPSRLRVALIEDNRLAREQLAALLRLQPDFQVVAAEDASASGVARIQGAQPQVVVIDAGSCRDSLHASLHCSKALVPQARCVVVNVRSVREEVIACILGGADGLVLADATVDEFLGTIRTAGRGVCVLPDPLTPLLFAYLAEQPIQGAWPASEDMASGLTVRERAIQALVAEGLSNRAIAGRLGIAIDTVKTHVRSILKKLTLRSRLQIAVHARAGVRPVP